MKKTDFSKVEKALEEGLVKATSKQLWKEADSKNPSKTELLPDVEERVAFLNQLKWDLTQLKKQAPETYSKVGYKLTHLKKHLLKPDALTIPQWKEVKEVRKKIETFKKELIAKGPQATDEAIVEKERIKHVTKRFNVNDEWLPLK